MFYKKYYGSASNISDRNIQSLNSILIGFSSNDLASLNFSSINSISTLGALSAWTYSIDYFTGVYQVNFDFKI